jgi:putative ABC transport system permease protein
VVSRGFADLYFHGQNAVGREIRTGGGNEAPWRVIAGVVADVRHSDTEQTPRPVMYEPFFIAGNYQAALALGSALPPEQLIESVRATVRSLDPTLALDQIRTMEQLVTEANTRRRFQTLLLAAFAAAAVCLALVGVYGLVSYAVRQRTAEVGLRLALGASRGRVIGMVLRQGLSVVAVGLTLGLAAALPLTRLVAGWLYGVKAWDPLTFLAVPALLLLVGLIASVIPAWKAAGIDPVAALRAG